MLFCILEENLSIIKENRLCVEHAISTTAKEYASKQTTVIQIIKETNNSDVKYIWTAMIHDKDKDYKSGTKLVRNIIIK